jgi:hypothetical protein
VRSHLIDRWQHDAIYQRYANAPTEYHGPPTIRQFVADILALPSLALHDSRFAGNEKLLGRPPFSQLDRSRFGELLATTVLIEGFPTTIDTLALLHVLIPSLRTVLEVDICSYPARKDAEQRGRFDVIASCGLPREEFFEWIMLPAQVRALADLLWPEIRARHAERLLIDFFTTSRIDGWYEDYDYLMTSSQGCAVRISTVVSALGTVTVELQRSRVETPAAVYPHAWRATLRDSSNERIAVASGMVYVPAGTFCDPSAFLATADEVSDADIMRVRALLDQFPARFGHGLDTGIAFLCNWERTPAGPKGAGVATLQAGLTALKRSMRKVTALAIDLRPAQFPDWDLSNEPAEIVAAKQEARERLQALLDTAHPEGVLGERAERFYILQRHDPTDAHHALLLLGEVEIERSAGQNTLRSTA